MHAAVIEQPQRRSGQAGRAGRAGLRSVMAVLVAALALIGATFADVIITAEISQNTLNYSVDLGTGRAGQEFRVTTHNDRSGMSASMTHTANANGEFAGAQSPGTILPGDDLTLRVYERGPNGEWVSSSDWTRTVRAPGSRAFTRFVTTVGRLLRFI